MNDAHHEPSAWRQYIMYQTHHRLQIIHVVQSHSACHEVESFAQVPAIGNMTDPEVPKFPDVFDIDVPDFS